MMRLTLRIIIIACLGTLAACGTRPTPPPTAQPTIPPPPSATPAPTSTPLPTRAALPTEQPRASNQQNTQPRAQVRLVHAAPSTGTLEADLNGQIVAFGLAYGQATGQASLPGGEYQLNIRPDGTAIDEETLLATNLQLPPGRAQLIVLTGETDTLDVQVYEEDTSPLDTTKARLSLVHAIPGGPLTTLFQPDTENEQAFPRIGFGEQSQPFTLPPGETNLTIEDLLQDVPVTLEAGRHHTLVLAGGPGSTPQLIEVNLRAPARANLTLVNLSTEAGPIDIYLDDRLVLENIPPFAHEDTNRQTSGNKQVAIYSAGANPTRIEPLYTGQVALTGGAENYLMLTGPAEALRTTYHRDESTPTNPSDTRITLFNSLYDLGEIEENRSTGTPLRIPYAQPVTRAYTAQDLAFSFVTPPSNDNEFNTVEFFGAQYYEPGSSYLILITGQGDIGGTPYIIEQKVGIDDPTPAATTDPAQVYIVNLYSGSIQALVNGVVVASEVRSQGNSDMFNITPGDQTVTLLDANTLEPVVSQEILFQVGQAYSLVYTGSGLFQFPATAANRDILGSAQVRLVNFSGEATRPITFTYMTAVEPRRRLSTIIDSPDIIFRLPEQVPRLSNTESITTARTTRYYASAEGTYDVHIYDPQSQQLLGSAYEVSFEADTRYDIVTVPGTENLPLTVLIFSVPSP